MKINCNDKVYEIDGTIIERVDNTEVMYKCDLHLKNEDGSVSSYYSYATVSEFITMAKLLYEGKHNEKAFADYFHEVFQNPFYPANFVSGKIILDMGDVVKLKGGKK